MYTAFQPGDANIPFAEKDHKISAEHNKSAPTSEYIKIEGTFVRAMLESESARKIVTHIHELAQSFGMETIAENVESEAIRSALAEIGIRNVQGWLYGEPKFAA